MDWLKARKKELKITDDVLAEALGVERSVANKVANGKVVMNVRRADAVAALLHVTRDEMLYRAGLASEVPAPTSNPAVDDDDLAMVEIQHIDMAYGMGTTFAVDYPEIDVLRFPKVWIESITHSPPATLTWTRGKGDSMEPTIRDGDLVLLDRSQRTLTERDAMWAFTIGEEAAIKRLRRQGDSCEIFSDNASVPPDRQLLRDINIVGRVVFVGARK
ncbi:S24 family peptidase [Sphingomonas hylomeconis]|uniref:S24 family peptidase n=1 Tax=Sphingomonas hylomeconis TaxID=1395958 RepID=A0ABV7SQ82_9SPHN